ncbi:PilN domain-containing protein [Alloalcanivorax xenomutans]|jgi:type IV pilus assembly protein PilN|uniref:PilN domain-containing protein n=1 Tax=Alloalcanivorax xenomutans TaxID=1094342 RepID=A0A9Q3W579_9GAMM|nr:PilN domain-containing protein [Alloalcanivorax xenomutans]ERS13859.1 pilus assembly protein PilN [Alcanivorax sp. PN-3]KYZ85340.1 pilus assembly protein PilN [Alcanivorax sp. KX64203]PHS68179.1 MAG: pilus assembly protein PilN [Alcanivorax sp.]ARB47283.1 pilus assembly protein PilN [Alloalcanivorax xenomutans]MCE7508298.1 PilN domain-containing protein [Alloalcanivorax xenomutans]|tara:strand:- start:94 stop:678 length:585 start_codon:yes stop_codon:yes gene_type:complete
MSTSINLLPWREARRKQRQQEFVALLIFAALLAGLLFWMWKGMMEDRIADQQTRNSHIQAEIAKLDEQIKEIKELETRRAELVARMKVIQELQGNRPTIVYVFDQLVRTLPDGVYYSSVERTGNVFTIKGVAESNNRVSRLMRNLDGSDWFVEPNLINVTALEGSQQANQFTLTVKQGRPDREGDEGENNDESL